MAETVLSSIKLILNSKGELALVLDTVDNKKVLETLKQGEYFEFANTVAAIHRNFNSQFDNIDTDIERLISVL
jgi:hypothetical protein